MKRYRRVVYKEEDIVIIMPTIGRPQMLENSLRSMLETSDKPFCVVVSDGEDPPPLEIFNNERILVVRTPERKGFWSALNFGMDFCGHPLVGFFGNDVKFHKGWSEAVIACFTARFKTGAGLMAIRDGIGNESHAAHGFISRKMLEIIYDVPRFPGEYAQYYGDGELTQFCKELGRFGYCAGAVIDHLHYTVVAQREVDDIDLLARETGDQCAALHAERYKAWRETGWFKRALRKL